MIRDLKNNIWKDSSIEKRDTISLSSVGKYLPIMVFGGGAKVLGYGYILWLNGCERHIMAAILVSALFKPIDMT